MTNLGIGSYLASGVAFLILSLLLLTSWKGRLEGGLLLFAAGFTALWSVVLAWYAANPNLHFVVIFVLETLRAAVWLTFMLGLISRGGTRPPRGVYFAVHGVWVSMLGYALLINLISWLRLPAWSSGQELIVGSVLLAVIGLVLIEQMYRNTEPDQRWSMKYLYLALGLIYVYDLFLYSHTLLFREIDLGLWNARGLVYTLIVPLVGISAARNPNWSTRIFVSRRFAFHTATVGAAAAYLLAMAAAGYYLRVFGGNWGLFLQGVFFSGALLLLPIVLSSGRFRARLKLFISKNFYNYKYDYRDEWQRLTRALARDDLGQYERAVVALAQPLESPGGAIWTRSSEGVLAHRASWNAGALPTLPLPENDAFVRFFQRQQWVYNIDDPDPPMSAGKPVIAPSGLAGFNRFWLVVPLFVEGDLTGLVVLLRPRTPQTLVWEDYDLLKVAGNQAATFIAQFEAGEALTEARQFEAFSRLSTFIMHDLKNVTGQLALIAGNAAKHKNNPAFIDDAFATVENSVARMKRLLAQLRHGRELRVDSRVELTRLLEHIVENRAKRLPVPQLQLAETAIDVDANADKLAAVIGNLVVNAQDAAGDGGRVVVRLRRIDDRACIEIADSGPGMEDAFVRDRLFKPFDTTKGDAGMGIGAYEAREYIRELGGQLLVESEPGRGSRFEIRLNLSRASGIWPAIGDGNDIQAGAST